MSSRQLQVWILSAVEKLDLNKRLQVFRYGGNGWNWQMLQKRKKKEKNLGKHTDQ